MWKCLRSVPKVRTHQKSTDILKKPVLINGLKKADMAIGSKAK